MEEQMTKALAFLKQDLQLEEEAAELYARQAAEIEVGWLRKLFLENVADEEAHAAVFRYAIERVEYSASNPTVSTGLDELDDVLYGGIPAGYAVVLVAPPLDERDLLVESFLLQGVDREETVLLASPRLRGVFAELVTAKPETFYLFLCSPRVDSVAHEWQNVVPFPQLDLTQFNIRMDALLHDLSERGRTLDRVVLDVLSDALLIHEPTTVRRWLRDLLQMLKAAHATVVSLIDPGMSSRDATRAVLDLFDGHFDVEERAVDGRMERTLTVRRLYGKKYLETTVVLRRENLTRRR